MNTKISLSFMLVFPSYHVPLQYIGTTLNPYQQAKIKQNNYFKKAPS